jgi:hypothetical protein
MRSERQFKPGVRNYQRGQVSEGRMSRSRRAWVKTAISTFVLYRHDPLEPPEEGDEEATEGYQENVKGENALGYNYRIAIPIPRLRKPLNLNLTALTEAELLAVKEFFDLAFSLALPVVRDRDRIAKEAWDAGDDSYPRVYRALPEFVVRGGKDGQHSSSLQVRSVSVSGMAGRDDSHTGRLQHTGGEVAERYTEDDSTEDDGPKDDEPSSLR